MGTVSQEVKLSMNRKSSAPMVLWIDFLLFIHYLINSAIILKNAIAGTNKKLQETIPSAKENV